MEARKLAILVYAHHRLHERACGGSEDAQLEKGAVMLPSFPTSSVLPRKRSWRVTLLARASAERERSISRGKSTCQRCGGV